MIKDLKCVVDNEEFQDYAKEFLKNAIKSLMGDVEALVELRNQVRNAPGLYKNIAFVEKLNMFLNDVCQDEEGAMKLSIMIADGDSEENAQRILDCIDSLETTSKAKYLSNATRSHLRYRAGSGGLDKQQYFRMLYILKNILLEDIVFLCDKLKLKEIEDSDACVALENLGLMYITTADNGVKYAFSRLAYLFYEEVVVYDDESYIKVSVPEQLPNKMDVGGVPVVEI